MKVVSYAVFLMAVTVTQVSSHSWYDPDCCGGADCMPIDSAIQSVVDGKVYYTTKLGTYPVLDQKYLFPTKIRQSKDQYTHACIYNNQLWCLYVPGGM